MQLPDTSMSLPAQTSYAQFSRQHAQTFVEDTESAPIWKSPSMESQKFARAHARTLSVKPANSLKSAKEKLSKLGKLGKQAAGKTGARFKDSVSASLAKMTSSPVVDFEMDMQEDEEEDEEEVKEEVIEFYSLEEIVELVTNPELRGTQDQTVLFYTYNLYASRKQLLKVIMDRLDACRPAARRVPLEQVTAQGKVASLLGDADACSNSEQQNKSAQIKVISLLRQWLKMEDDFHEDSDVEIESEDTESKEKDVTDPPSKELSPQTSETTPPMQCGASAVQQIDSHTSELNLLDLPAMSSPRHRIAYSDDFALPPFVKLSPFAAHFRSQLIEHTRDDPMLTKLASPLLKQLAKGEIDKSQSIQTRDRTLSFADAPAAKIPKVESSKDIKDLSQLSATEVARQICLCEYDIFKRVRPGEFVSQQSTKQRQAANAKGRKSNKSKRGRLSISAGPGQSGHFGGMHTMSGRQLTEMVAEERKEREQQREDASVQPNIDKMTAWFNKLVVWAQIEILYHPELKDRVKALSFLLKVCDKLEKHNNISSLCALRAGLCAAPIHRLRKTWEAIPRKSKEIKAKIDELFKLGNGQKALRERVSAMAQPAIPHLGLFLGDIVFIHDGNETREKETKKVNWSKMKLLADRIAWISMFQQSPFIFERVLVIQEYLEARMKSVPEDFLYKLSRNVEPPEKK